MDTNFIATASIDILAAPSAVWEALVDPTAIRQYMFGTQVVTNWQEGSPIVWKGEWQGKAYEDKGEILIFDPPNRVSYSHFSPLSGQPDVPENYHRVTIELSVKGQQTRMTLTQDNNQTEEERQHSQDNWKTMLENLKHYLEGSLNGRGTTAEKITLQN